MSSLISSDTLFIASWTTLAAFQACTAIHDGLHAAWKWWRKFRRPATDYKRVINGETRRGWQVAIPLNKFWKTEKCSLFHLWTDDLDNQSDLMTPPSSSFFFEGRNPLPNGKVIHHIRRFSFIQPNASATLLNIVCDPKEWNWYDARYLTSRNLMVTFRRHDGSQYRIFLMDAFRKNYQMFAVATPEFGMFLSLGVAYLEHRSSGLRLHLMWAEYEHAQDEIGNWRLIFTDTAYAIPENGNLTTLIHPSSPESIVSFPIGNHEFYYIFGCGIPVTAIPFNNSPNQDQQNPDNIFCLTFGHDKKWKRETLTHWLAEFEKSATGKRIRNAAQSYLQLTLPKNWIWMKIREMKEFNRVFTVPKSDALFAVTDQGILKRWIRPPSLQRMAAEHLFRANPDLKMSEVKKATGIDLSDGIGDEEEEQCEMVML